MKGKSFFEKKKSCGQENILKLSNVFDDTVFK
jgi:hypothetical protein